MAEQDTGDLYGEIDALYGKLDRLLVKRPPDALAGHDLGDLDFPRLTEVVEEGRRSPSAPARPRPPSAATAQALGGQALEEPSAELMAAIEARLFDLLARHQQEVDEAVRRIVREELAKRK